MKTVPVSQLRRLRPLIAELKKEGRKSPSNGPTINITRVAEIAKELQHMIDEWLTPSGARC
jgi:hypothetical protein